MLKKIFFSILLLFIFIFSIFLINKYFKPFFVIVILFFLCFPLYEFLKKGIKNDKINSIICIISINIALSLLICSLGDFIIKNINYFFMNDYSQIYAVFKKMLVKYGVDINSLNNKIQKFYNGYINTTSLKKGASFTSEWIFAYLIANIVVFFLLKDRKIIIKYISHIIPYSKINILLKKTKDMFKIFKIEIVLVLLTTLETIICFWILNIKSAFILGLICGILDILPYVGTFIVFLPLIIYKLLLRQYSAALFLTLVYIMIVIIRQILEAKYISIKFKIHPLILIISIYIGVKICGFAGVFIGPLYSVAVKELILGSYVEEV